MSNKISEETKKAVLDMFIQGASKAEIARKHGISPRSVGRIIDNHNKNLTETKSMQPIPPKTCYVLTPPKPCVVQQKVRNVMEYVRKEMKGIEALTYLLESIDSPENLERYRNALVHKLTAVNWWVMDVKTVKLGIHTATIEEVKAIRNGEYGIR